MTRGRLESLRHGWPPLVLYPLLSLLSFPTLTQLMFGENGLAYAHDAFDLPRSGVLTDWSAHGPQLWNTHVTAGNALLAQQAISPYAIDVWLAFVMGPFGAYAVSTWAMAAVAGVSMHLFLRDALRLPTVAVLVGAIIYTFAFWQVAYAFSAPAIPLLLWLGDRSVAREPDRWRFLLAWTLVAGVLLYHAQSQIVLLAGALQLVWILLAADLQGRRLRVVGTWLGAWLLAFGLFAPVLITQVVMLPISQRAIWDLGYLYDARPLDAIVDTLRLYSASLLGAPVAGGWGASPAVYGTYFMGAAGVVLAVIGIVIARHDRRTALLVALLLLIPVADLAAVLLTPLQEQAGALRSFQLVRVRHLYPFVLAVVAALGLAALVDRDRMLARVAGWRWAIVAVGSVPVAITFGVAVIRLVTMRRELLALETEALGWALVAVALILGVGLVLAALALALRGRGRAIRSGGVVVVVALAALIGERVAYAHGERFIGERELGTWAQSLSETSGQAFLRAQPRIGSQRVMTLGDHPNRMGYLDLLQVDGYQAIYPLTYHTFFGAMTQPYLATDPARADYFGLWGNRAYAFGPDVDPELVALVGVRWLYVVGGEVPSVPGAVERFHEADVTVYEVPDAAPRAFVAGGITVAPTTADVARAIAAAPRSAVQSGAWVVDGPDAATLEPLASIRSATAPGTASIVRDTPDEVDVEVDANRAGVLVLTDVMAPGWVAERDGTPVPIATVDVTFRGVAVDQSTRRVVFRYRPTFTYLGFAIAVTSVAGSLLWAAWSRRRERTVRTLTGLAP